MGLVLVKDTGDGEISKKHFKMKSQMQLNKLSLTLWSIHLQSAELPVTIRVAKVVPTDTCHVLAVWGSFF